MGNCPNCGGARDDGVSHYCTGMAISNRLPLAKGKGNTADLDAIRARAESVEVTSTASDGTEIVYCGTQDGEYVGWTPRENAEANGYEVVRTKPNEDVFALLAECGRLREQLGAREKL